MVTWLASFTPITGHAGVRAAQVVPLEGHLAHFELGLVLL
jgi:hypothetical protein